MNDEQHDVLEHNVSSLLETGGEPPRISDPARARIRAELIAKHGAPEVTRPRSRRPVYAVVAGLAAAAAIALLALHWTHHRGATPVSDGGATALADGSTFVTAPGGQVTVLGPRHVRVAGAALLDVVPGKGTFTVETARGTIQVLGTRFYVDGEPERTTAAVVRGEVRLASDAGDVLLHAGEQGVAEPGRAPVRGPAPRLTHLVSWAQEARRREEHLAEPIHHGTLFAREPFARTHAPWGSEYPLPITKLGVDIVVEDQVARVALDQTFHNGENENLEGVYRFAIPPDAALQRFAMYNDGRLEEAAVVERMQARRIYEQLVYRRIDPGLLEWAGTGRLALRVYPIPAHQDKRLVLAYTQSLPKLYDDWTLTVPLPDTDQPAGELDVSVRVKGCADCELSSTSHQIAVARDGGDAIVTYKHAGEKLGDSFVLHVRDPRHVPVVATHADGDDHYLLVRTPVAVKDGAAPRAYHPRTWVILDDVSASRSRLELGAQEDLVDAFLRELDEDDRVAVVAFDVTARDALPPTRVADVDRRTVRQALHGEGGVGATDFSVALAAATRLLAGTSPDDAMVVYLGDGVITSGPRELDKLRAQLAGKAHFIGVGVGDGPDTQTLDALADATAGYATTIDLADDLGWRAFDLVAALHTPRVTGVQARLVDAQGAPLAATAYLRSPELADGDELELVAKLGSASAPAAVELTGTRDGAPWQQTIALAAAAPHDGGYLPRLWAQRHIAARLLAKHEPVALPACAGVKCPTEADAREARDEAIRKEVVALGKRYFLLSRHTSLLVLENDAMYAQYGVQKGRGDTWAPYALPERIAVKPAAPSTAPLAGIAADAELVREPLAVLWQPTNFDYRITALQERTRAFGPTLAGEGGGGADGYDAMHEAVFFRRGLDEAEAQTGGTIGMGAMAPLSSMDAKKADGPAPVERHAVTTAELGGVYGAQRETRGGGGADLFAAADEKPGFGVGQLSLLHLGYPTDPAFDDVTGFVPALVPDAADAWRARLLHAAAPGDKHVLDPAARDLLAAARRALPAGLYRWGGVELAVDGERRLGWRRTTEDGLAETASFDGATWVRRYGELDLDVTRAVGEDDLALALAYLPIWIADPAHYARWFDVTARGREVTLATQVGGKAKVALVLAFDDRDRLVAVRDGRGATLLEVTWSAAGPTAARAGGEPIAVGFTPEAIADAPAWAHAGTHPGVAVELPVRLPSYWQARVTADAAGSPAWRHDERQWMASLAAAQDRGTLAQAYDALLAHGGVELGDLALASGGISIGASDRGHARLAPLADQPLARYLAAGNAYARSPEAARLAPATRDGLVGALWSLRAALADLVAERGKAAATAVAAIPAGAPRLHLAGAIVLSQHYDVPFADVARAWDSISDGPYVNVALAQAAQALANRADYEGAAARIAKLAASDDLHAVAARYDAAPYMMQQSRRGAAGWQLAWATWRDRVLAGDSLAHVMAILPLAAAHPDDLPRLLARAAALAGDDPDREVALAQLAAAYGQSAWAEQLLAPLAKSSPSHDVDEVLAHIHLSEGRLGDALGELEAAQDAGGDEPVDIATMRAELGEIVAVARELALQASGAGRAKVVARALAWGDRWRAIDPGNPAIDEALGELLLAVGDSAGAWRQLSSTIERDPWSGTGYMTVADAFEREGKVDAALPFWQQAIVIDQTNPTPRLRKAQALIALGRTSEGDALLEGIASQRWHDMWSDVVYQAKDLLARGKAR